MPRTYYIPIEVERKAYATATVKVKAESLDEAKDAARSALRKAMGTASGFEEIDRHLAFEPSDASYEVLEVKHLDTDDQYEEYPYSVDPLNLAKNPAPEGCDGYGHGWELRDHGMGQHVIERTDEVALFESDEAACFHIADCNDCSIKLLQQVNEITNVLFGGSIHEKKDT